MNGIKERVLEVIQSSRLRSGQRQAAAASEQEIVIPGMQIDEALARTGDNMVQYKQILQDFKSEHVDTLDQIRYAINKNDLESAIFLAHTTKIISRNIGASELAIAMEKLEYALMNQEDPSFAITIAKHKLKEAVASIEMIEARS